MRGNPKNKGGRALTSPLEIPSVKLVLHLVQYTGVFQIASVFPFLSSSLTQAPPSEAAECCSKPTQGEANPTPIDSRSPVSLQNSWASVGPPLAHVEPQYLGRSVSSSLRSEAVGIQGKSCHFGPKLRCWLRKADGY